ncbi:hypothetical protein EDB85DRAFT_1897052 [Lactarius pseudohatsudake]|nr:hypothetical protein EDB85DRAFT_1897052 [Lactarius pseudohatsudake]
MTFKNISVSLENVPSTQTWTGRRDFLKRKVPSLCKHYRRHKIPRNGKQYSRDIPEVTGNNTPVIFPKSREMIVPWISPWHPKEHNTPTNAKQREIIFPRNTWGIGKQSSLGNPGCIGKDIPVVAAS